MKERPIIFNTEMVRAILDRRKTQTRRPVKPQSAILTDEMARDIGVRPPETQNQPVIRCPFGEVGDRLWVRETWAWYSCERLQHEVMYRADGVDLPAGFGRWRPSIHMPRWASRLTLEVTGVRVERLCAMNIDDAWREGFGGVNPVAGFADTWDRLYGDLPWIANPWVWVIDFRGVEA